MKKQKWLSMMLLMRQKTKQNTQLKQQYRLLKIAVSGLATQAVDTVSETAKDVSEGTTEGETEITGRVELASKSVLDLVSVTEVVLVSLGDRLCADVLMKTHRYSLFAAQDFWFGESLV